jgi:hypothetical protein
MQMVRNIKKMTSSPIRSICLCVLYVLLAAVLGGCNFLNRPDPISQPHGLENPGATENEARNQASGESRVVLSASQLAEALSFRNLKVLFQAQLRPNQVWLVRNAKSLLQLDAKLFFSDSQGGLYRLSAGNEIVKVVQRPGTKYAISDDFQRLAILDALSQVQIHDLSAFLDQNSRPAEFVIDRVKVEVLNLRFQGQEPALLLSGSDGRVYRWRYEFEKHVNQHSIFEKGKGLEIYVGSSNLISSLASHPSGRMFAAGDWSGSVIFWLAYDSDIFKGEFDTNMFGPGFFAEETARRSLNSSFAAPVSFLSFNAEGDSLFMAGETGGLEVFQVRGLKPIAAIAGHKGLVRAAATSSDFNTFATCGRDAYMRLWTIKPTAFNARKFEFKLRAELLQPECAVLEFASDGQLLVLGNTGITSYSTASLLENYAKP